MKLEWSLIGGIMITAEPCLSALLATNLQSSTKIAFPNPPPFSVLVGTCIHDKTVHVYAHMGTHIQE